MCGGGSVVVGSTVNMRVDGLSPYPIEPATQSEVSCRLSVIQGKRNHKVYQEEGPRHALLSLASQHPSKCLWMLGRNGEKTRKH